MHGHEHSGLQLLRVIFDKSTNYDRTAHRINTGGNAADAAMENIIQVGTGSGFNLLPFLHSCHITFRNGEIQLDGADVVQSGHDLPGCHQAAHTHVTQADASGKRGANYRITDP